MIIWLILALGSFLRVVNLNQSLWLDEAINILAVKNYSLFDLVTQYARADFHPPGWFIILWCWGKLFGYSEISMRFPSVIFGIITIYITFLIGKKLVSKNLGLITALLVCINPLHVYYSQEARMYSMAALVVSINILLLIKLIKNEKVNLFFLVLSNIAVLASDYIAYFIFPAQFIFLLVYKRELVKKWLLALFSAILLGIWWLPTFLGQFNVGSIASANLPTWKFVNGAFDFKTLPLTFVKFIIGRISLADKFLYGALLVPVCSLIAFLIWRGIKTLNETWKKLLIFWVIIPLVVATLISIVVPVYNYFRVLFVLPGFIILVSLGILSFKRNLQKVFLGITILIEVFCTLVYLFNPAYHREDWKGLVLYLQPIKNSQVLFESSGTLPPFDYYAKGNINALGALKDFPARSNTDLINLEDISQISKDIFLIDYLVEISDKSRLVDAKLKSLGYRISETKDFRGVGFIYHYVK